MGLAYPSANAMAIAGDVSQLIILDGLWTDSARRNNPEELEELGSVVDHMDLILTRLSDGTKVLQKVLEKGATLAARRDSSRSSRFCTMLPTKPACM